MRFLRFLRLLVVLAALWVVMSGQEEPCQDKLVACAKAHDCAKKPDSRECQACKSEYGMCTARNEVLRATKKKPIPK